MSKAVEVLQEIRDLLQAANRPLLNADEVSDFLGFGIRSVHRAENGGEMPAAVQTPGGPRWRREELIEWVRSLRPRKKKARRFKPRLVPVESAE
jgi:predicted DNA-binding transcriptional regulator AlpA